MCYALEIFQKIILMENTSYGGYFCHRIRALVAENQSNLCEIKRREGEKELTRETNSCPKSSEGWMSSNASRMSSLQINVKCHSREMALRVKSKFTKMVIYTYTAKSSS